MAYTLIIIKPDAVSRGLAGTILARFERRGLRFVALEMRRLDRVTVEMHYEEHRGKPFFDGLVEFLCSGPAVLGVLEGPEGTAASVRKMMGTTNPAEAAPGTIRGDFAMLVQENLIHGSDSEESALREVKLFFPYLTT